jgi:N-acyl-D-amino-acid deacylase
MNLRAFFNHFLTIVGILGLGLSCASPSAHYDILIKDSTIVDGTGQPSYQGDLAIQGDKIAALGEVNGTADLVIDGTGLITSPGFIDPHSHADNNILKYPLAHNFIMQGVTTMVNGNCGGSPAPTKQESFAQYLTKLETTGITPNVAMLVGHIQVREVVMGQDCYRKATPAEIEQMKAYVKEAMQSGAYGLSAFLDPPACGEFSSVEDEIIPLAQIAGAYGGGYWPHHRHHRTHWASADPKEVGYGIYHGPLEDAFVGTYRGLVESVDIARRAQCRLHIAHLVNAYRMPQPHPDFLDEAAAKATLAVIDQARKEGLDISFDVTFSRAGVARRGYLINDFWRSRNLALAWLNELSKEEAIKALRTEDVRAKIREIHEKGRLKLGMIQTKADPYWMDRFKILACKNNSYVDKTVAEIAQTKNMDALDVLFALLEEDPDTVWVQHLDDRYFKESLYSLVKHPNASLNIDWACTPPITNPEGDYEGEDMWYTSSPIAYGMFPDYLGKMVRDEKILSLEEAINRITYVPAHTVLGLTDRGMLKTGAYADIVVFDLQTIRMKGDFLRPAQPPDGIPWVIINGRVAYRDKAHTGVRPGKVIRHPLPVPAA